METTKQIAQRFGVTGKTIRALANSGRIPAYKLGKNRGKWMYRPEEVEKALKND